MFDGSNLVFCSLAWFSYCF